MRSEVANVQFLSSNPGSLRTGRSKRGVGSVVRPRFNMSLDRHGVCDIDAKGGRGLPSVFTPYSGLESISAPSDVGHASHQPVNLPSPPASGALGVPAGSLTTDSFPTRRIPDEAWSSSSVLERHCRTDRSIRGAADHRRGSVNGWRAFTPDACSPRGSARLPAISWPNTFCHSANRSIRPSWR